MAARNWLALELDEGAGKLWASWRCETKESFTNHLLATDPVGSRARATRRAGGIARLPPPVVRAAKVPAVALVALGNVAGGRGGDHRGEGGRRKGRLNR